MSFLFSSVSVLYCWHKWTKLYVFHAIRSPIVNILHATPQKTLFTINYPPKWNITGPFFFPRQLYRRPGRRYSRHTLYIFRVPRINSIYTEEWCLILYTPGIWREQYRWIYRRNTRNPDQRFRALAAFPIPQWLRTRPVPQLFLWRRVAPPNTLNATRAIFEAEDVLTPKLISIFQLEILWETAI